MGALCAGRALNSTLAQGGPDLRFHLMPASGEPYVGFADMRPYHGESMGHHHVSFLGQAWHATQKLTFNDTLNLLILKESPQASLRAFSTSQIGGA